MKRFKFVWIIFDKFSFKIRDLVWFLVLGRHKLITNDLHQIHRLHMSLSLDISILYIWSSETLSLVSFLRCSVNWDIWCSMFKLWWGLGVSCISGVWRIYFSPNFKILGGPRRERSCSTVGVLQFFGVNSLGLERSLICHEKFIPVKIRNRNPWEGLESKSPEIAKYLALIFVEGLCKSTVCT